MRPKVFKTVLKTYGTILKFVPVYIYVAATWVGSSCLDRVVSGERES